MIPLQEAIRLSLVHATELPTQIITLSESAGRILGRDAVSDTDMPPFTKSAMDGFACRKKDLPGPLKILETIAAGKLPEKTITPGTCSRIMTGAPVPEGADCVIVVEKTEPAGPERIRFTGERTSVNICSRGEDLRKGEVILRKGEHIRAQEVAMLATAGYGSVEVYRQPLVGIASTGNELYPPEQDLPAGSIRDSNSHQLYAQVVSMGLPGINYGIVEDSPGAIRSALDSLENEVDVIILTGGVSAGDYDFVPGTLEDAGFENVFYKMALKPGMPLWFGRKGDTFCFALPGNPVSTFVQFEYVIKPFLYKMMGSDFHPMQVKLPLGEVLVSKKSERDSILPVRIHEGMVYPAEYHGSAHIGAIPHADGFIRVPGTQEKIKKGEFVDVRFI